MGRSHLTPWGENLGGHSPGGEAVFCVLLELSEGKGRGQGGDIQVEGSGQAPGSHEEFK